MLTGKDRYRQRPNQEATRAAGSTPHLGDTLSVCVWGAEGVGRVVISNGIDLTLHVLLGCHNSHPTQTFSTMYTRTCIVWAVSALPGVAVTNDPKEMSSRRNTARAEGTQIPR